MSQDPYAKINELSNELNDVKGQLNDVEAKNRRLQGLSSEVEELRASQRAADRRLKQAREERDEAVRTSHAAAVEAQRLQHDYDQALAEIKRLNGDLEHARDFAGKSGDAKREAQNEVELLEVALKANEKRINDAIKVLQG